jgi:plastocyanin
MYRRTCLISIGTAAVTALAGCTGGDTDQEPEETPSSPSPSPIQTTAEPTQTPTPTATETATPTQTPTPTPIDAAQVVTVGSEGRLRFEPDSFEIAVGDTVVWTWAAGGHNVVPNSIPDDSEWTGTEGGSGTTYDDGHVHEHSFSATGSYSYYCSPHRSSGMTGSFTVFE